MLAEDILLIFDCDGTLVDSEGIANQVFIDLVRELGAPLTAEEAWRHFPGTSLRKCMEYVSETYGQVFPDDFVSVYRERQKPAFAQQLQPIDGVTAVLERLVGPKCVASNGPREIMLANLATTGLVHFFGERRIYSAHDIQLWKPKPDLFLHAAADQGFAPERCIVIEDSDAGIEAAIKAQMKVIAYVPAHGHYKPDQEGVYTIEDMAQLPQACLDLLE